jgi:cell wall-associated NlpC family hydrolase
MPIKFLSKDYRFNNDKEITSNDVFNRITSDYTEDSTSGSTLASITNIAKSAAQTANNLQDKITENLPSKVTDTINSWSDKKTNTFNPFLDSNGNLVNPYLNYQKLVDSGNVTDTVKGYIQEATGITPTSQEPQLVATLASSDKNAVGAGRRDSDFSEKIKNAVNTAIQQKSTGTSTSKSSSNLVESAKKYMGTPYVWGGDNASEGGLDCSGFVYNALKDAGYNVGRDTAQGYRRLGTKVSQAEAKPGDLVFYIRKYNNGTVKAGHIAIYLGDGKIIHSSGGSKNTKSNPGKGVCITNINGPSGTIEIRRLN